MANPAVSAQSFLGGYILDKGYTLYSDGMREFAKGCKCGTDTQTHPGG